MRVLFAHELAGFHGGAETWVYQVARGLAEHLGYECHLAFTNEGGRDASRFQAPFADSHPVDQPARWHSLCARLSPHVVCVNNVAVDHLAAIASVDVPAVRMLHDHELSCLSGKRLYTWSGRACHRTMGLGCWACLGFVGRQQGQIHLNRLSAKRRASELTGRLHRVLVASRYMRDQLAQAGIESSRIEIIAPGLDDDSQRPADPSRSSGVQLLFAGQVIRGKGLDLLIRALAQLPDRCRLVVAGTGNALEKNRALAHRLGVAERVRFLGWVGPEAIDECYAAADIVVVPSRWPEPFGLVGLEAMRRGRPVVAYDVGGIADWLEHGRTGLLVAETRPAALAAAIRRLVDQPALRRTMGLAGRAAFLRKFTLVAMLERVSECFEKVSGVAGPQSATYTQARSASKGPATHPHRSRVGLV